MCSFLFILLYPFKRYLRTFNTRPDLLSICQIIRGGRPEQGPAFSAGGVWGFL